MRPIIEPTPLPQNEKCQRNAQKENVFRMSRLEKVSEHVEIEVLSGQSNSLIETQGVIPSYYSPPRDKSKKGPSEKNPESNDLQLPDWAELFAERMLVVPYKSRLKLAA